MKTISTTTVSRGVAHAPAGAGSAGGLMSLEYGTAMRDVYTALNNRAIRPDTGVPDEWRLPGGILRFGIPRRLDGQVRMEIQKREYFAPAQDTLWSIDAVH